MSKCHISETTYDRDLRFDGGLAHDKITHLELVWSIQMVNWSHYEELSPFQSLNADHYYDHFESEYLSGILEIAFLKK